MSLRTNVLERVLPVVRVRLGEVLGELVAGHEDPLVVGGAVLLEDVLPVGHPGWDPVVLAERKPLQPVQEDAVDPEPGPELDAQGDGQGQGQAQVGLQREKEK